MKKLLIMFFVFFMANTAFTQDHIPSKTNKNVCFDMWNNNEPNTHYKLCFVYKETLQDGVDFNVSINNKDKGVFFKENWTKCLCYVQHSTGKEIAIQQNGNQIKLTYANGTIKTYEASLIIENKPDEF